MRVLLIVVVVVVLMTLGGWLVFNFSDSTASVEVRADQIKNDTTELLENAKETLNRAGEVIEEKLERP